MLRAELDNVHRVRKAHGGIVNDVLLTLVAGALWDWLTGRGPAPTRPLRALVPVSHPHPDPADTAGNRLSGYLLDLPVHEPDPLQRLRAVRHAMTMNKAAGPGRRPGAFPVPAGLLPPLVHRLATPMVALTAPRLFNTVITQGAGARPAAGAGRGPVDRALPGGSTGSRAGARGRDGHL